MELGIWAQVLLAGFGLAVVFGAVATKTNFCTMGAVSDWVNIGDTGRMRAWVLAIAVAILGVLALELSGLIDMSLTTSNDTSNPPYRISTLVWPRYILGGLLFGIGMTLGSGCGNKTLIRLGGGNAKSIIVLACIGISAYVMMFTSFDYYAFLQWMNPVAIEFSEWGANSQEIGAVLAAVSGADAGTLHTGVALVLGAALLFWAFKSTDLRGSFDNILGGLSVGAIIAAGWYVTAGPMGQLLLEEVDFMDQRPLAVGAQSFTFVQPSGQLVHYLSAGMTQSLLTFAMAAGAGVILGALLYSLITRKWRFEWFANARDFINHVIGGVLMGIGGVLGLGCTIGQGVTGISTLSIGAFLTFGSIVFGSALTMKIQYYKMLYEDASFSAALTTALVELHVLPAGMRKLEAL